jgi:lysophospholipase L1-like esterase
MSVVRSFAPIAVLLLFVAGCSQTPTAPSSVAPPSTPLTATSQETTPNSPALTFVPARAVGIQRFVAFGDSITWGALSQFDQRFQYAAANGGYPERILASLTAAHAPQRFTMFNEGLPGELAVNALTRFRAMLTTRKPECVLLLEGINDLTNGISPSSTGNGLRQMLDAAAAAGVPVIIATMYPTYEALYPDGVTRPNAFDVVPALNAQIRLIATGRLNVHLVDLEPIMRDRSLVGNDGLHANEAGFDVMAAAFVSAIQRVFPVRGSFQ